MELKINNLCFAYSGSPVLRNIEAMAQAGEITAIAGPNGAGKSTLLKCIARLLKVSGGTIKLGEQDFFSIYRLIFREVWSTIIVITYAIYSNLNGEIYGLFID